MKRKNINIRITDSDYESLIKLIIKKSNEDNKIYNISDYIRLLIKNKIDG